MPVYNAEKYLKKNMEFFKKNECDDIEFILVNDGSTDNGEEIIQDYNIKNLVYIAQENHGVSYTRNVGIQISQGEYISFLDSDDSLADDYFNCFRINYEANLDIIRFGVNKIYGSKLIEDRVCEKDVVWDDANENDELLQLLFTTNKLNTSCNQWIKSSLVKNMNLKFYSTHKYAEDFEFNRSLFLNAKKVKLLSSCLYNYYINQHDF